MSAGWGCGFCRKYGIRGTFQWLRTSSIHLLEDTCRDEAAADLHGGHARRGSTRRESYSDVEQALLDQAVIALGEEVGRHSRRRRHGLRPPIDLPACTPEAEGRVGRNRASLAVEFVV